MVHVTGIRSLYMYLHSRKAWMWSVYGEYVEASALTNLTKVDCTSGMGRNPIPVNRESAIVSISHTNGKFRLFLHTF